jgi:hypothetical protein
VSMLSGRQLTFLLALSVWLVGSSCKRTHAFAHLSSRTLLQIARDYSPSNPTGHVLAVPPSAARSKTAPETLQNEQEYKSTIKQYFSQGNLDQLEKSVREARESKGRLVGGGWKLFAFYDAINTTFIPEHPDESDWKMYLDSVKQWLAAKPDSAAAHISLAQAYVGYAWQARGGGYADSVTEEGWELYGERIALAADLLAKAARLKEKCPFWFETMQNAGQGTPGPGGCL